MSRPGCAYWSLKASSCSLIRREARFPLELHRGRGSERWVTGSRKCVLPENRRKEGARSRCGVVKDNKIKELSPIQNLVVVETSTRTPSPKDPLLVNRPSMSPGGITTSSSLRADTGELGDLKDKGEPLTSHQRMLTTDDLKHVDYGSNPVGGNGTEVTREADLRALRMLPENDRLELQRSLLETEMKLLRHLSALQLELRHQGGVGLGQPVPVGYHCCGQGGAGEAAGGHRQGREDGGSLT